MDINNTEELIEIGDLELSKINYEEIKKLTPLQKELLLEKLIGRSERTVGVTATTKYIREQTRIR